MAHESGEQIGRGSNRVADSTAAEQATRQRMYLKEPPAAEKRTGLLWAGGAL